MFRSVVTFAFFLLLCSFAVALEKVDKLKFDLTTKTLHKGQSITIKSEVYYRVSGGNMSTRFKVPYDKLVMTNLNGEYKEYDFKANKVTLLQGPDLSSKNSIFYSFLSGSINDMGLGSLGYRLTNTRVENKLVITTWVPISPNKSVKKVEIAHENHLPVFLGFFNLKDKPLRKSFYSNYQQVGLVKMPFTVIEFDYISENDSAITKKTYSNLKLNAAVEDTYLNFKIPAGATVVSPQTKVPGK